MIGQEILSEIDCNTAKLRSNNLIINTLTMWVGLGYRASLDKLYILSN